MNMIEELRNAQNLFKRECDAAEGRSLEFAVGAGWGMYHAIDNLIDTLAEQSCQHWTCRCGAVNGVNLAACRVCGRKEGGE